jgi:hypothetical protein
MSGFITKIDYSDNRQIRQYINTSTDLSGTTVHGVTFSAITSGPDPSTSGVTLTLADVYFSFSGNPSATVFTFTNPILNLGSSSFSAITDITSGEVQSVSAFTADSTTTIDGNLVALSYTGVSYGLTITDVFSGAGPIFSGTGYTNNTQTLSAGTLDFTGRTLWADVKGILRTEKFIISNNPVVGYVLTCTNSEGMVEFQPASGSSSGSSFWSAGSGTNAVVMNYSDGNASGNYSLVEGRLTEAKGNFSHAEGSGTTSIGRYSHAEGRYTTASGIGAHAEGDNTIASGLLSHAQGSSTLAIGQYSHAEGNNTIASGASSHSQGEYTLAGGWCAHVGGLASVGSYVIANNKTSFNHSYVTTPNIGVYSDYSTILGGTNHNINTGSSSSSILGGDSNRIGTGCTNSVIIGGTNITAITSNMVYVPDLVIDGLTTTDPIATDASGKIVAGVSDARLKQNIVKLENSLDKIKNLRGVSFEYTTESNMGGGIRYGFIAQEVQSIIPDIVRNRAKSDDMLSLNYNEIVPLLVEAVKELVSGDTQIFNTERIVAEDNNIELNYNGTHNTAINGGIVILKGVDENTNSLLLIDNNGNFIVSPSIIPEKLILPKYTPQSSNDSSGEVGEIRWDDNYMYIKTNNGWRRTNLETF